VGSQSRPCRIFLFSFSKSGPVVPPTPRRVRGGRSSRCLSPLRLGPVFQAGSSSPGTNCHKHQRHYRSGWAESTCRHDTIWSVNFGLRVNSFFSMKATHTALVAKLVVVIDDNPLVLEATRGLLRSWGCCVVTAESCDDALVRLAETEAGRRPDLIVCDYQLSGGLTGVDAIERLRSACGASEIPALLVSGAASAPQCEVGSRAYQLLYKPVNAERFHSALVASVLT
jgi:CheY-like chemotaxis protein